MRAEIIAKAVGKRIRELRKKKGWSQERLADESQVHRSYMCGIEQGRRNPSLRHLSRIADALEVPIATLFDGI
jgi:transcriptional regulator with XRE-family HTH domain